MAAEESTDPKRDMPKGIMLGMFTLIGLGFLILIINPAIPGGSFAYGTSGQLLIYSGSPTTGPTCGWTTWSSRTR